jgi:flagellar basal body-associated protein FliL
MWQGVADAMESKIKSSFIPRDTSQNNFHTAKKRGGSTADIFVLLSIVLLVASLALGVAVFLYVKFLESSLGGKKEQLQRAEASFEPALIAELNRLDDRMRAGEEILDQHIAPSVLFRTLEELTLNTVSFTTMQYLAERGAGINIEFSGVARSVNSIALQADLFAKHGAIVSPIFSNINRDQKGVRFDLSADINPSALRYSALVNTATSQNVQQQPAAGGEDSSIPLFAP